MHSDIGRLCSQQKRFKFTQHLLLQYLRFTYTVTVKDSDILDIVYILGLSKNNSTETGYSPFCDWRGKMGFVPCWIGQEGLAAVFRLDSSFQPVRQGSILIPCSHLKSGQVQTSMLCVSDKSRQWTFSRTLVQAFFRRRDFLRPRSLMDEADSPGVNLGLLQQAQDSFMTAPSMNAAVVSVCLHFYFI